MMVVYKTFTGEIDRNQDIVGQQNAVRNQLVTFLGEAHGHHYKIIQISETVVPENDLFAVTVWFTQPDAKPAADMSAQPEAQSADVLSQLLREKGRRDMLKTMVDEHMIRSDSS